MSFASTLVCPINPKLPGGPPEQSWDNPRDADVLADGQLAIPIAGEDEDEVV